MSTWYFKVASWLRLFFSSSVGWKARLFCITEAYTPARLHAHSLLFSATYVLWEWSWRVRLASRLTRKHTLTLKWGKKWKEEKCTLNVAHAALTLCTPSFPHLAVCLVSTKCNGILSDYYDPPRGAAVAWWCTARLSALILP